VFFSHITCACSFVSTVECVGTFTLSLGSRSTIPLAANASAADVKAALEDMVSAKCVYMDNSGVPQPVDSAPLVAGGRRDFRVSSFEAGATQAAEMWSRDSSREQRFASDTAFCGRTSLFFMHSFGRLFLDVKKNYSLSEFPYLCTAYRVPPTSLVSMLLYLQLPNSNSWTWRQVVWTMTKSQFGIVGDFAPVADDKCVILSSFWKQFEHFKPELTFYLLFVPCRCVGGITSVSI
jgi:hypothetical protein